MFILYLFLLFLPWAAQAAVEVGADRVFEEPYLHHIQGKKIGLVTNQTGVNKQLKSTINLFKESDQCTLAALFSPEHGLDGAPYAGEAVDHAKDDDGVLIYSLHGKTRRPSEEMLRNIDTLVFDIQEIGCRSYTYATTLFYLMEEAAKKKIPLVVLDRPNPMGGLLVDGPMLSDKWRSFLGYVNVPYCHGMTLGELALFFNAEYQIGATLHIVPMKGWRREMTFQKTGLPWIPPSPNIPEPDTPFFCASTGVLGELEMVNIGIGYTLPFKVVGAPWIKATEFAEALSRQKLPGVRFLPYHYRPFYGRYKGETCHGVKIVITNARRYKPLSVQYSIIGLLKTLYPKEFQEKLQSASETRRKLFCQVSGNDAMLHLLHNEKYVAWKLIHFEAAERDAFLEKRKPYLIY